ncbi:hypothetical protein SUGI_0455600 [Cryptomeria japonica]|nr:hypothetical protein SUGI_0455600 [Cryptomeria japonica]
MMSAEGDLMLPYSDNLLHGGDFGDLDRVMLTDLFEGVTIPQPDFDSGDLFSSTINDSASYDDDKSLWNGDIGKQGVVESEENKATTHKMRHLSLESMEETPFAHFAEAKLEPEPSILMGYSSSNGITSSYPSLNYSPPPIVSPNSQLATSFVQASVVSSQISLPNGQISLSNGQIGLPNGQINMSNGSSKILTSSASNELVLDDREIFSSPVQFSSTPITGPSRSIEVGRFVTKEDASEDSLSPLPTYTHKPSMMQRSFSSHSLGQLRITPRVHEPTSFYPQYSTPMYSSVLELSSPDSRLQPQLSDLQGMNIRPSFKAMRRVCSAGDIQTLNGIHMSHGSTSPLTPDNLSTEEAGFKIGRYSAEERKERIHRYRMKRSERNFNKKIKYACRKTLADSRPRIRGRFARNEDAGDIPPSSHHDEDDEDEVDAVQEDDEDFLLSHNSATHAREMIRMRSFHRSNGYPFGF